MGGLFSARMAPGPMVYSRAASYANTLKTLKGVMDPDNIMNPGSCVFEIALAFSFEVISYQSTAPYPQAEN
jgi:hypothetical protein